MKPGILVSTPDLRPSLMSILKGLDEAALLKEVITTLAIDPEKTFWKRGIERRFIPDFLTGKVRPVFSRELIRLAASRLGSSLFAHRIWQWSELGFDRKVARIYSGRFRCIYGMEHSSLETFAKQKALGGFCILRQVMVHGRTVADTIKREINKFPEYATVYERALEKDMSKVATRKEREYELADLIVANSGFARDSFVRRGVDPGKVVAITTGCPLPSETRARSGRGNGPLVFLFAGTLSLRKGLPYLIKAWRLLKPERTAELWLAGRRAFPEALFKHKENGIRYLGILSHRDLAHIYNKADALVLPTLLEGCAHVVLEALSHGMPVITTRESGCGTLVQDGHNGFIINSCDAETLCSTMAWCLEHRDKLERMGNASREQARSWTVENSNRAHLTAIRGFLKGKPHETF